MKKVVALILTLLMIISVIPFTALAEEIPQQENEITELEKELPPQTAELPEQGATSGKCGLNLTWSYNTTTCVLTISGKGDMYDYAYKSEYRSGSYYNYSTAPWGYSYGSKIKSVVISENVTSIGVYAFYNCSSLISVTISNSITTIDEWAFYYCSSLASLTIPSGVVNIGTGAFYYCSSLTSVIIPDTVTSIGARAFFNCRSLTSLTIPSSVITIGDYAFYGCSYLNCSVYDNAKYIGNSDNPYLYLVGAKSTAINSITVHENTKFLGDEVFHDCSSLTSVIVPDSVTSIGIDAFSNCTSLASVTIGYNVTTIGKYAFYTCNNLNTVYYSGGLGGWNNIFIDEYNECLTQANRIYTCHHTYGEWTVVQKDNRFVKVHSCSSCLSEEEKEVFNYETINYNVNITNAENISIIRYAAGEYSTPSEIKRSADCVTLTGSLINDFVQDGIFTRTMANGGIYTFNVKTVDETDYIFKVDLTYFTQELSSVDNKLTVSNLYGVSDIFFCMGYYDTWTDVKANNIFRATENKINGAKSYTYAMPGAGEVTVYVKYTDTTREPEFYYTTLTKPEPTITQNGLDITIDDLTNVKCIKRVFGRYTTPSAVKAASGVITYSSNVAKGEDSAVLHIPHEGELSVMIQYKSGYTVVKNITIEQKHPTFTQDGNKVTIGNLDDLYVVRYAKGTYAKANAIKVATGSKYLRADAIVNRQIVIDNLEKGTYTFLVQYNEQSQNIYTITVE